MDIKMSPNQYQESHGLRSISYDTGFLFIQTGVWASHNGERKLMLSTRQDQATVQMKLRWVAAAACSTPKGYTGNWEDLSLAAFTE